MTAAARLARPVRLLVGALTAVSLTACSPGGPTTTTTAPPTPPPATSAPSEPSDSGEVIATGLDAPWSIAFHGQTALLSERDRGRILELTPDGTTREVGTVEGAVHRGEGGLLGLAVLEDWLYAFLTTADDNRIVRYRLEGTPGALSLSAADTILAGLPAASYHNGGRIAFGPDGMLYATAGDAGNRLSAQDPGILAGKILRMTPDGGVPADNPFPGSLVYSLGHRNPQGLAWDQAGTLYASEFGQNTWDELNVIQPGGNYGWPTVEGIANQEGFIDPVQQWPPAEASPSGMAVADGQLHLANLRGERLRQIPLDNLASSTERLLGEHGRLRDVTLAPDGFLWVLTNNTDGRGDPAPDDDRILRLQP